MHSMEAAQKHSPRNPFSLAGRTILITGGTQGVGGAIARSIAQAGGDLVIHGLRDDSSARDTLSACRECGVEAELLIADLIPEPLSDSARHVAETLCREALRINPHIDSLVNNAGTYLDGDFLDTTSEIFYRTFQLNVAAGLFLTRALVASWLSSSIAGRIVFTGSINGLLAEAEHVCYDASKGAVAAMVRSLCAELAPRGIRVNAMAPGLVITPMTQIIEKEPAFRSWMEIHTPNRRVPEATVCGPPTVFLLSDAAEHIHGQTLYVDGGMSAWQQPSPPAH